MMDKNTEV